MRDGKPSDVGERRGFSENGLRMCTEDLVWARAAVVGLAFSGRSVRTCSVRGRKGLDEMVRMDETVDKRREAEDNRGQRSKYRAATLSFADPR